MIPVQRDHDEAQGSIQRWLASHHPAGKDVVIGAVEGFAQGYSSEVLTFDATYPGPDGPVTEGLVLRVEPGEKYQLFLDTNFEEQYRVMQALGEGTRTAIPRLVGFESDASHLGARFYVMERAAGLTGQLGVEWMFHIGDDGLNKTWWNGLSAMAEIHKADAGALGLQFLDQPSRGPDPLDQQLQYYWEYYCWVRGGETHPVVESAYDWLRRNKPEKLPPNGIVWGDAKRGNQLFGDDLGCTAVLDFEMASLGPAEMDLGWWLEGEYQTAESLDMTAPPDIDETVARYSEMIGRPIHDIEYWIVFAALRIAVLRIKLHELREGLPFRGGPRDGDIRLSTVLERYTGRAVAVYA